MPYLYRIIKKRGRFCLRFFVIDNTLQHGIIMVRLFLHLLSKNSKNQIFDWYRFNDYNTS